MSEPRFDTEKLFGDDYLYFYERRAFERTGHELELAWRLLELKPGVELLDLACGHGRLANPFAERGVRVTGLDITPMFLELARADAAKRGVDVEYVAGDMRELPWRERFDRVLLWFTSFGYFGDEDNRRVLREAHAALRPGGLLVIDLNNRDSFASWRLPAVVTERDGNYMIDLRDVDARTGRVHTERVVVRDGETRRAVFSVRMYTFTELRDWLLDAGFAEVDGYDWETGGPLAFESRRMVSAARKAARASR